MIVFFEGMLYGLASILFWGPAFFALIQTSIRYGFLRAMCLSVGVNMTDAAFIILAVVGFGPMLENPLIKNWVGIVGAVVLFAFGLVSIFRKAGESEGDTSERGGYLSLWLKGVVLNGFNPLIAVFWIGIVGSLSVFDYSRNEQFEYFGGFITSVLFIDAFKASVIARFKWLFSARSLRIVNLTIGIIMIGFGIRIIVFLLGW